MVIEEIMTIAAAVGGAIAASIGLGVTQVSTDGPLPLDKDQVFIVTKGSAAALTIPPPINLPGRRIVLLSNSAFAHVLVFTGGTLRCGTAATAQATCAAQKGASLTLVALQDGSWGVLASVAQTFA